MGIEFKRPGDKGWNPYGKKNQVHLSGWGCIVYPVICIAVIAVCTYFEINVMKIILGIMFTVFIIAMIGVFLNKNFFD